MRAPKPHGTLARVTIGLVVALATVGAGAGALATISVERRLSAATVELSTSPFHPGALDIYVPVVDWGLRFDAVRLPAQLNVDLRGVDRDAALRIARDPGPEQVTRLRADATRAITSYIRLAVAGVALAGLAFGLLVAVATAGRVGPRLRYTAGVAVVSALASAAAVALLLPPRGSLDHPEYYANGADIPRALRTIEAAGNSAEVLSEELDAQLVGLARLVSNPAARPELGGRPRLVVASDLHNNVLTLPALERAAQGAPVFFVGDLTDRGSRVESGLVRRVVDAGTPFVFVSGNHDSDEAVRTLVHDGAIVLTRRGRLRRDGAIGPAIVRVAGLRVAGYDDPFQRRDDSRRRQERDYDPAEQEAFLAWLRPLLGRVDAVMVHAPALAEFAMTRLREEGEDPKLLILTGHTHRAEVQSQGRMILVNGGTVGAGGTGNLGEGQPIGLARLVYRRHPFAPLAADLVEIDPGDGSATARRERLTGE